VEVLEPLEELPAWFDPALLRWPAFSASSLWLIDGLARYLGECLRDHVPGARWSTLPAVSPQGAVRKTR
jgi:hypothetical protein